MHCDSPVSYDVIGTRAAPATLTASFADNRATEFCKGFAKAHIEYLFTPGENNEVVYLLLETSTEETHGGATNFYPLNSQVASTSRVDIYADAGTGMGTDAGLPYRIPGDGTSTSGTAISGHIDVDPVVASYLRLSASSNATTFGTLFVRVTFFPAV